MPMEAWRHKLDKLLVRSPRQVYVRVCVNFVSICRAIRCNRRILVCGKCRELLGFVEPMPRDSPARASF